jgi:hypothetical protein
MYLISLKPSEAVPYVYECMRTGDSSSMAWSLMEDAYGPDWKFRPEDMPEKIYHAINKIAGEMLTEEEDPTHE